MRYGIQPVGAAERLALWLGLAPVPVIDVLIPLVKARAIMAGVKLGVFACLARSPCSAPDLAVACHLDAEGARLLLRVLHGAGYVTARRRRYELTRVGRTLAPGAAGGLSAYVEFNYAQWGFIEELESVLHRGFGIDLHQRLHEGSETWSAYQRAMLELARPVAPFLARRVPVRRGARRLLDLGGAHGLLGATICRAHAPMRSTVIELPSAVPEARRLAREEDLDGIVQHQPGDLTRSELGSDCDVVLVANVLHHLRDEQREALVVKIRRALVPGGTLAIWETEAQTEAQAPELARDVLSLYFHVTSSSPPLTRGHLIDLLCSAGFERVQSERARHLPGRVLVHARTPRSERSVQRPLTGRANARASARR